MQDLQLEKSFFHFIISNKEYYDKVEYSYFEIPEVSLLYKITKAFKTKYPESNITKDQVLYLVNKNDKYKQILNENLIDVIYRSKDANYDKEWFTEAIESWIRMKSLETAFYDANVYLKSHEINIENTKFHCDNALKILNERGYVSFSERAGHDFFDHTSHLYNESIAKKRTGYTYIDTVTGGIAAGQLWVIAGETNVGKSIWLANLAKSIVEQGSNVAYISCEMDAHEVIARIGANMFDVEVNDYYKIMNDEKESRSRIDNYKKMFSLRSNVGDSLGKLIIEDFPTSLLDVPTLERFLVDDIEKKYGIKIDVLIIDYINIMKNWRNPNSENTYNKIKQLAEDIRGLGKKQGWGTITVTQVKLGNYNASDLRIESLAESAGLGHTADVVFAIIQDEALAMNNKYRFKPIKNRGRGFKNTSKTFDIYYEHMRIVEDGQEMITY